MTPSTRNAVLVPIDFSEASFRALDEALSTVSTPSAIHVIHVVPDVFSEPIYIREPMDTAAREQRAEAALRERLTEARHEGVDVIVKTGNAGEVIAETAEELGCDLIVIPSHGRTGLSRLFLGSVAERVLRLAHCPVLVLRLAERSGA